MYTACISVINAFTTSNFCLCMHLCMCMAKYGEHFVSLPPRPANGHSSVAEVIDEVVCYGIMRCRLKKDSTTLCRFRRHVQMSCCTRTWNSISASKGKNATSWMHYLMALCTKPHVTGCKRCIKNILSTGCCILDK